MSGPSCKRGFSLIELLVTLAILALLASMAAPLLELTHQRKKEHELQKALQDIRQAIDAYKAASDAGRIEHKQGESGYPPDLNVLFQGVPAANAKEQGAGKKKPKIFFLRRLPRDPLYPDTSVPAERTWGKRSYESEYDKPKAGKDVYDVYSLSPDKALNGTFYREW